MNPPLIIPGITNGHVNGNGIAAEIPVDFIRPDLPSKCKWHEGESSKGTSPHTKDDRLVERKNKVFI